MMPQWISDLINVAPWLGGLALAVFVVWKIAPVLRKFARVVDRITGVPEDKKTGQPAIPGIFETLDHQNVVLKEQSEVLEDIRHEVQFNNGTSVKDGVTRLETDVGELKKKLDAHLNNTPPPQTTTVNVNQ